MHWAGIKNQIAKSFSSFDKQTNTQYITNVRMDRNETDFVLEFVSDVVKENGVDPYAAGTTEEIGNVKKNKFQVVIEKSATGGTNQTIEETSRTGAHEIGHGLGLYHPKGDPTGSEKSVETIESSPNNLMRQSEYSKGTEITTKQLEKVKRNVEEQQEY